jgi:hypothetical protein
MLPFPFSYLPVLSFVAGPYIQVWNWLVPWAGSRVFGLSITVLPNGSGDTTYNYVQAFCQLQLAAVGTLMWTALDSRRTNYPKLHAWLRALVRFYLATTLIWYGSIKVIQSQFPAPPLWRFLQPYGESSPMGLLWTFMGMSTAYNLFTGLGEMVAGLLLTMRRTTLLGALISLGVMSHVAMLNFSYDVPVKLWSTQLLLLAFFLIVPDLARLASFFVLHRSVDPVDLPRLFDSTKAHRAALTVRTVWIFLFLVGSLAKAAMDRAEYAERATSLQLYGIWEVDEFELDGKPRPPLLTDSLRWRRIIFEYPETLTVLPMSGAREDQSLSLDAEKKTLVLTKPDDPKWRCEFIYAQPQSDRLTIEGTFDGKKLRAALRRVDESSFLLTSRGFHWINEYPFNR